MTQFNYELPITNYELGRAAAMQKPSFPPNLIVIPASTVIPAPFRHSRESGNPPLARRNKRNRPPPSFRRRPESRTPVGAGVAIGQVWIPAFAGMTVDGGNDGMRRGLGLRPGLGGAGRFPLTQPSPAGRGLFVGWGVRFRGGWPGIVVRLAGYRDAG